MKPTSFKEANSSLLGGPAAKFGTDMDVEDLPAYRNESETISCWKASWRERFYVAFTGKVWLRVAAQTHPPVSLQGQTVFN